MNMIFFKPLIACKKLSLLTITCFNFCPNNIITDSKTEIPIQKI